MGSDSNNLAVREVLQVFDPPGVVPLSQAVLWGQHPFLGTPFVVPGVRQSARYAIRSPSISPVDRRTQLQEILIATSPLFHYLSTYWQKVSADGSNQTSNPWGALREPHDRK